MNTFPVTPLIKSPMNDFVAAFGVFTVQDIGLPQCQRFEIKYLNCMEAYGVEKGYEKCKDLLEDFRECQYGVKQEWRFQQMRKEFLKQSKDPNNQKKYEKLGEAELAYPVTL